MDFSGIIIEESLADTSVLKDLTILTTDVEPVTAEHQTPWLTQWTLHTVEVPADRAAELATRVQEALSADDNWYADFKNDREHYIIFKGRIFRIDRSSQAQYQEATDYAIAQGVPPNQADFSPCVEEWHR